LEWRCAKKQRYFRRRGALRIAAAKRLRNLAKNYAAKKRAFDVSHLQRQGEQITTAR
jgi:hypothetical protein